MQINKHRIIPVLILVLSPLCLILFLPGTTHSRNDFILLYTRGKTAHLVKLAGRIPTAHRKKKINGKAAYALGRSCYIEHYYEKAAFYLNKSILNSGRYYEDHALYYLGKAQLELKNNKAAFKAFRRLADTFPGSIYYRQAVYHTAKLAYDMKDYKPAAKYFLRSADLGPAWYRAGRTFRGARSLEHLGRTSEAIAAYFHLLAMETYGQYNTKCLKRLEEAGQLPPDTQKQKLLYIKALIRAKRSNEAESLLKQSEKKTTSAYFKFQHALIYSWIFRRRSLWHKAYSQLAPYLNIKKLTKNERIQLLTNLYYIQKAKRKYSQALKTIKKIHVLRSSKASGLFTNLAKAVEKQPKLRWKINITAAGLFPGRHFYLSALFQELTRTSRKNNIQSVIKKAQILLKFDKERNRRSGIYYFLGKAYERSGKQKSSINAYRASITENPLGFYHHFLKKKTKLQLNFSSSQTNVNMLCRNYFLFSNSDKKKAISHIRKLWKKLTIIKKINNNLGQNKTSCTIP